MVAFGRSLGLRVVAEGVEDHETLTILAALDCDLAQGYLISRPLEPAAMTRWLTTHLADRASTSSRNAIRTRPTTANAHVGRDDRDQPPDRTTTMSTRVTA